MVIAPMVTPPEPVNLALPAVVLLPIVKVSAATVPEKVTSTGAALVAFESLTLMVLPVPVSVMVPATVIVEALSTVRVEEPLKAIVDVMVTSSFTVAVLLAAMVKLVAVTAALKVALLFKVMSARDVVPTIPVIDAEPLPSVNVKSRAVLSLSIVELKVMLLLVVVNMTSLLNTTAPEYVCVDDVVTSAPRLEVPDTDNEVVLEMAASRLRLPVISITSKSSLAPTVFAN